MSALISKQVIALFEDSTSTACVYFRGRLTRDLFLQGQQWLADVAEERGMEHLRGAILDFRRVEVFERFIPMFSRTFNLSIVPQALLVHPHQSHFVAFYHAERPYNCVVTGRREALHFMHEWNTQHERAFPKIQPAQYEEPQLSRYVAVGGL
jgi:hypothetical protein